jgi:hypothetical protein
MALCGRTPTLVPRTVDRPPGVGPGRMARLSRTDESRFELEPCAKPRRRVRHGRSPSLGLLRGFGWSFAMVKRQIDSQLSWTGTSDEDGGPPRDHERVYRPSPTRLFPRKPRSLVRRGSLTADRNAKLRATVSRSRLAGTATRTCSIGILRAVASNGFGRHCGPCLSRFSAHAVGS